MTLLRDKLQQMNEEQRLRVAQYWGAPTEDAALTAEALVAHMTASAPVRTAFDQLDAAEKDAVRAMDSAAHKGWVVTADIRRFAGVPETRVADLVRSLEGKGVAFTEERELPVDNPYWGPTWAGRRLPTSPKQVLVLPEETVGFFLTVVEEFIGGAWHAETPSPLNQLESLPPETLRAMAGHYGVPLEGTTQSAVKLASLLQPVLKDPAALWQVINALPPHLRAVLDAVEAAGGRLAMEIVRQRFAPDYPALHSLVEALTERALAFDRFFHRERVLLAPDRVLETIAQHTLPELPRARLDAVPAPASEERWRCELYWSALLLVRSVRLDGITRTASTHKLPKRTTTRFMEQVRRVPAGMTAEEWLEQNIRYLAAVGVLTNDDYIYLAQKEPRWLQQDSLAQAKELLNQWLAGRIEDMGQSHWEIPWMDHPQLAAGRALLVDLLRDCRPGQWYSLPSLLRRAAGLRPFFLRERERLVRQQGYRGLKRMLSSWFAEEGRVLLMHLVGLPLALGMIALDRPLEPNAKGALPPESAFQLTEWGAALLGLAAQPALPDPAGALVVQPNFDVVALDFVPSVLDVLGQFAAPVAYDRIATYHMEHRWINLAVANGWTGPQIVAYLEAHARVPVPQNVRQSILDWASAVRRARFVRALVVEAEDPAVLEDLAAARALRERVRRLTGGSVLLVAPDADLKQIARELRAEGFVLEEED